jgi:hypothetical protein
VNCADHYDLCLEAEVDPNDPNVILVQETEDPTVTVRTTRKNFAAFVAAVKEDKYADLT